MDDFKSSIANLTKTLTKTSGEFLKTTKLSVNLVNEEANLKSLYMEVGKKVQEVYAYGGSLGKYFDEKYREMLVLENKISHLKENLDSAKGYVACGKCGKNVLKTSEYCPKCGAPMYGGAVREEFREHIKESFVETVSEPAKIELELPVSVSSVLDGKSEAASAAHRAHTPVPVSSELTKVCIVCGSKNQMNDKFCLSCGRAL